MNPIVYRVSSNIETREVREGQDTDILIQDGLAIGICHLRAASIKWADDCSAYYVDFCCVHSVKHLPAGVYSR